MRLLAKDAQGTIIATVVQDFDEPQADGHFKARKGGRFTFEHTVHVSEIEAQLLGGRATPLKWRLPAPLTLYMGDTLSTEGLAFTFGEPVDPVAGRPYLPDLMGDAETWAIVLVTDATNMHVLAEGVVGFRKSKGKYVLAQSPLELQVLADGTPAFVVVTNLGGKELSRVEYARDTPLKRGDAIRIRSLYAPVE